MLTKTSFVFQHMLKSHCLVSFWINICYANFIDVPVGIKSAEQTPSF